MIDCFNEEVIENNSKIMKKYVNRQNYKKNGVESSGNEFNNQDKTVPITSKIERSNNIK